MLRRAPASYVALVFSLPLLVIFVSASCNSTGAQAPASPDLPLEEIPSAVKTRLDRLQTDVTTARTSRDAKKQSDALIQLGDLYLVIYDLAESLDAYQQALSLAR